MYKIEYTEKPDYYDTELIINSIWQGTHNEYGYPSKLFGFFIRDEQNKIIAGLNFSFFFESVHISYIWVADNHRKKGFARKLMDEVHKLGREKNCKIATLNTFSFQNAEVFYKKMGYKEDFRRPGYTNNSEYVAMSRNLINF